MAHTNSTTNYALPQFLSTDKPAWLTDVNPAYTAIDTGMHNAQTAADAAQNDATQALSDAATADGKATTADAKASGAVASIAESFDATATYSIGEYVTYNNLLYVCSADVVTPGPWTGSTNWTRATLDSIVTNMTIQDLNNVTLTTSDNNKLLGVSVSGGDINVGAIGVKQKAISFQSTIAGNDDKGYTISDILTEANVSSDKLISIEFGGARALAAWSEVHCTTWLSISGGTHGFYFHNFGTGGNAEFSFLVTYFD